ncbi:MAG: hypothetical protein EHM41_06140 [Chloroflexi bacterium]|nr:MAG: hypothetical protein EHM41_06140 [Chloroflexota bacterium]
MIPKAVQTWCRDNGFGEVVSEKQVGGGCINNGAQLLTSSGKTFFLKTNSRAPEGMFAREAEGLDGLRVDGAPRVPNSYLYNHQFILLEDLAPASRSPDYWSEFGRQLAVLHTKTSPRFGFEQDNFIGSTRQPNPWTADGFEFFGQYRLFFQSKLAQENGYFNKSEVQMVEKLASQLRQLIPEQPASIIHGDLWSGNALTDSHGNPALIDPAAHYGWAEAELAMTALFGPFPASFYTAYEETRPLRSGYRDRFPIYNLYHLLNHLNLFGEGYYGQVMSVVRRYAR